MKRLLLAAVLALTACDQKAEPKSTGAPQASAPSPVEATAAGIDPEREYTPEFGRCLETGGAAQGVTYDMAECIGAELERQDARLNAAYQAAMSARTPEEQQVLRQVQREWIRRRDAECDQNLTGGTIDRLNLPGCRLRLTTVRAVELERMAQSR